MQVLCRIDWLSFTLPLKRRTTREYVTSVVGDILVVSPTAFVTGKPMMGYEACVQLPDGTMVMWGEVRMGIHIILSGKSLNALRERLDTRSIIEAVVIRDAKITRLDIAIDVIEGFSTVGDTVKSMGVGVFPRAKRTRHIVSENGGETFYVGSPQSTKMLRIYNKKAERIAYGQPVDYEWVRYEVELKEDSAQRTLRDCHLWGIEKVVRGLIEDILQPRIEAPTDVHLIILEGVVIGGKGQRAMTNTRQWLIESVSKTLAKQLLLEPGFAGEFHARVEAELERLKDTEVRKANDELDNVG